MRGLEPPTNALSGIKVQKIIFIIVRWHFSHWASWKPTKPAKLFLRQDCLSRMVVF